MTDSDGPWPSGQRVLVTGGGGFVGGALADALVGDNEVRVLDDFSTGERERVPEEATVVAGDVRDAGTVRAAMDGVDVVFHQAGLVSVDDSTERPAESESRNVAGTVRVLDAARRADARAVVASSAAVYGHPETVPVPEDAALSPTSPYGVDKVAVDHYTRLFADLYDLPTVALRYFNVYGPGQPDSGYSGVVSTFLDRARADEPLPIHGDGTQTRDFVHVDDVVRANLRAAETSHVGRAFNVGTGEETTVEGLARTVVDVVGADSELVHADGRPGDIDRSVADLTAATRDLDFRPRTTLADGLATLVDGK
ncbi:MULTISPECIES: NAD-dependent epimerase/dehydratase family protein [Salinibaculum]|uniref:NAD-dependent epimerase/dehydratase family protein n=1 Tax=Salinibaculum TaxID=2732368 RepID=UPI0030CC722A